MHSTSNPSSVLSLCKQTSLSHPWDAKVVIHNKFQVLTHSYVLLNWRQFSIKGCNWMKQQCQLHVHLFLITAQSFQSHNCRFWLLNCDVLLFLCVNYDDKWRFLQVWDYWLEERMNLKHAIRVQHHAIYIMCCLRLRFSRWSYLQHKHDCCISGSGMPIFNHQN